MITLYHLCDYMRGPMSNPYYKALRHRQGHHRLGAPAVGTPVAFLGHRAGRVLRRCGSATCRTLIIGAILQPIAHRRLRPAGLARRRLRRWSSSAAVQVTAFQAIMAFDSFAIGFAGVALVSYMSTPDQPRLHRHPVRPADLGAGLDRQVPQGLSPARSSRPGSTAAACSTPMPCFTAFSAGDRAAGDRALRGPGAGQPRRAGAPGAEVRLLGPISARPAAIETSSPPLSAWPGRSGRRTAGAPPARTTSRR